MALADGLRTHLLGSQLDSEDRRAAGGHARRNEDPSGKTEVPLPVHRLSRTLLHRHDDAIAFADLFDLTVSVLTCVVGDLDESSRPEDARVRTPEVFHT